MNDFLSKLSIYDQLGYLAVGGLFYICLLYDQTYIGFDISKVSSNAFNIAIAVYFLGHLAQSFARRLMPSTQYAISDTILKEISDSVGNSKLGKPQAFDICFLYALTVDKTGRVEVMNARYGLFRGWTCVLALQAVVSLGLYLYCRSVKTPEEWLLFGSLLCAGLAWITADRSAYFYQEIAHRTINTYLLTKPRSLLPANK